MQIEQHQADLLQHYKASVAEKVELAARKELTTKRVQRAIQLIAALSDEKVGPLMPSSSYTFS